MIRLNLQLFGGGDSASNAYGTLSREYVTGAKVYTGGNVPLPADEVSTELRIREDVVKNAAAEQLGVRKSDIELDTTTGLLTVWTDNVTARKQFYQVQPVANTVFVSSEGRASYYDVTYKFQFRGSKM